MSCYLIQWENTVYANDELFIEAVAGGERAFMKMLSEREVIGKKLFDQMLYPLTAEQEVKCREYKPIIQNFDEAYKGLNVISKDTVKKVKAHMEAGYPNSTVITITEHFAPPLYKYRQVTFFKVLDYKAQRKYAMVPKMAAVKVCGRLYVALNAVGVHVETPIIVTIDN
jgi:thiol-disulfide isomerase/thioredoxin